MKAQTASQVEANVRSIGLVGDQSLRMERRGDEDLVRFVGHDGQITLSVRVTERGPVLSFEGADIVLRTTGQLSIQAERLELVGRTGASITTEGDLDFRASGDCHSVARSHGVEATLGDVHLTANDDVKMSGERIRMNC